MFDIVTDRGKAQYQGEMIRLMQRLEVPFAEGMEPIIRRAWELSAESIEQGLTDFISRVDSTRFLLNGFLRDQYRKIAAVFGDEAFRRFEEGQKQLTMRDRYWMNIDQWAGTEAAEKVVKIGTHTREQIARVLHRGLREGMSNEEIAKNMRSIGQVSSKVRSRRIARTETHTASVNAVNEATKSTGLEFEREWISSIDDRIRGKDPKDAFNHIKANGERVGMEEPFRATGESLRYPGDSKGSPGNIINCRCVLLYHRKKREQEFVRPDEDQVEGFVVNDNAQLKRWEVTRKEDGTTLMIDHHMNFGKEDINRSLRRNKREFFRDIPPELGGGDSRELIRPLHLDLTDTQVPEGPTIIKFNQRKIDYISFPKPEEYPSLWTRRYKQKWVADVYLPEINQHASKFVEGYGTVATNARLVFATKVRAMKFVSKWDGFLVRKGLPDDVVKLLGWLSLEEVAYQDMVARWWNEPDKWDQMNTLDEQLINDQFYTKWNIQKITWGERYVPDMVKVSDVEKLARVNALGQEMAFMCSENPEIPKLLRRGKPLGELIVHNNQKSVRVAYELATYGKESGEGVAGFYWSGKGELHFRGNSFWRAGYTHLSDEINWGGYVTTGGSESIFRHELGHHLSYKGLATFRKPWRKIVDDLGGLEAMKVRVTKYAGENFEEAYAESFTIFTDERYRYSSQKLPEKVHEYMLETFRGSKGRS